MTETIERPEGLTADSPMFLDVVGLKVSPDAGTREVTGLALPYGEELARMDWITGARKWVFEKGSAKVRDTAKLAYGHDLSMGGMPIGKIIASEDTDEGLRITARVSETAKGNEVYTLLKDGVLDRFSVGFYRVSEQLDDADTDNPILTFKEIDVFEVSVVPDPAFDSAVIDGVLSRVPASPKKEEKKMTETQLSAADVDARFTELATGLESLSGSIETLDRRIATLGSGDDNKSGPVVPGHSYGEFLKMLADKDEAALSFLQYISEHPEELAYTGGVIGDLGDWVKDSWVGDIYRPVIEKRRLHNLFSHTPLPSSGNNVEFGRLLADTTAVEEQVAEGDVLAYGKLTFDTATAPVKTYGGWADMSRQQIQRSGVAVVQFLFEALINRYAQATEVALRTVVANVANSHALAGAGVSDLTTSDGWTDFIIDASFWLDDKGLSPEFVLLGRDKFKAAAKIRVGDPADGTYMLDRKQGTMNVVGLTGEIFTLPVIPVNVNGLVRVGHSSAIRTFEDGAAPFRLQDSDITNLTDAFSIYGYEAIAVQDKDALVSPDVTA